MDDTMKRILLDTNVYGRLVEDPSLFEKLILLVPHTYVIYGTSLIRKELRDVSNRITLDGKNKRIMLLQAYNSFVRKENHNLEINDFVILLANKYFEEYKKKGGVFSIHELLSDFTIVACASLHNLNVVVSDDKRTMLSEKAKAAYITVNQLHQFRTPSFYFYNQFKEEVRRMLNDQ